MKPEEELCRSAYHRFLEYRGTASVDWIDGSEPPDYFVELDGKRFAVEVTRIIGKTRVGNQLESNQKLKSLYLEVFDNWLQRIKDSEQIDGTYVIRRRPIPNLKKTLPDIEVAVRNYIRETRGLTIASAESLPGDWTIRKTAAAPSVLGYIGPMIEFKWEVETREELREYLDVALKAKVKKLRDIPVPVVLLLFDEFHLANTETWSALLPNDAKSRFNSILRIDNEGRCEPIWK